MKTRFLPLLVLLIFVCISCSDLSSGSGSTEVGNPIVVGTVYNDGKLLTDASVYVLESDAIIPLDTTISPYITNSLGKFYSDLSQDKEYRISVLSGDSIGAIIDIPDSDLDTIELTVNVSKLACLKNTQKDSYVTVQGTPFTGTDIVKVPAGVIPTTILVDTISNVTEKIWDSITIKELDTISVLHNFLMNVMIDSATLSGVGTTIGVTETNDGVTTIAGSNSLMQWSRDSGKKSIPLSSTTLNDIATTSGPTVWLSSNKGLYSIYNGTFTAQQSDGSSLISSDIQSVGSINDTLFILTPLGINQRYKNTWDTIPVSTTAGTIIEPITSKLLAVADPDNLWFVNIDTSNTSWTKKDSLNSIDFSKEPIISLASNNAKQLWIATSQNIILYDNNSDSIIEQFKVNEEIKDIIYNKNSNRLWVLQDKRLECRSMVNTISLSSDDLPELLTNPKIGPGGPSGEIVLASSKRVISIHPIK